MAEIIEFPQEPLARSSDFDLGEDTFLLDEGLELLAYYRSITDSAVRESIMTLLHSLALARPQAE